MIPTAFQTAGPFFPAQFIRPEDHDLTVGRRGERLSGQVIELEGQVFDGSGDPMVNAILELWQADPDGKFPAAGDAFRGWGRTWTDDDGRYRFRTLKPGPYPVPGQAWTRPPHLSLMVLGSGLMRPLVTQLFFPDEPLNQTDRQLLAVTDPVARGRLILEPAGPSGVFRFDIRLRGDRETPFLAD
ncbi:MAG: protocatechuate 3,4-dioxygenase subunit alpha [Gemmatimonadales bacterium]|nr:protocatechuate 3,4-dioxygenase subunit alpha [Gemmatimonadales bacterium]